MCSTQAEELQLGFAVQAAPGRGGGEQEQVGTILPEQVRRGGVPEILTDQHTEAAETGIESPHGNPRGEEATFIEQTVGGQVDFVVDMDNLALGEISRSDVETVAAILVHKTNDEIEALASLKQVAKDGVVWLGPGRDRRYQVLQDVAGKGKFREDQQVHAFLAGLFGQGQVLLQVGLQVAEFGTDLGEGDCEFHIYA